MLRQYNSVRSKLIMGTMLHIPTIIIRRTHDVWSYAYFFFRKYMSSKYVRFRSNASAYYLSSKHDWQYLHKKRNISFSYYIVIDFMFLVKIPRNYYIIIICYRCIITFTYITNSNIIFHRKNDKWSPCLIDRLLLNLLRLFIRSCHMVPTNYECFTGKPFCHELCPFFQ